MPDEQAIHEMTRAELVRTYREFSDYDLVGSTERAKKFIQAARQLLLITPKRSASSIRGEEVEMAPEVMQLDLRKAETWFAAAGGAGGGSQLPMQYQVDECWR